MAMSVLPAIQRDAVVSGASDAHIEAHAQGLNQGVVLSPPEDQRRQPADLPWCRAAEAGGQVALLRQAGGRCRQGGHREELPCLRG